MNIVDAHQHFWNPARGDYGWMPPDDPILSRVYMPADLLKSLKSTDVCQTVLVQAAPTTAETEFLLGIAEDSPLVAKVVGWIDFEDPNELQTLRRFAEHPKFAGVRPMIQDIPEDDWMLRGEVQWAYQAIIDLDLSFDCLGFPQHLESFHSLLTRYPEMRAVVDHCMKPQIRDNSDRHFQFWADGIRELAEDTQVFCKLSGLVTEVDDDWSLSKLQRYADQVIAAFGPARVMWGSDWPVARLRLEYRDWYAMCLEMTEALSASERQRIFSDTAREFYRI